MQPVALACLYVGGMLLGAGTIGWWGWPGKHTSPAPLRKAGITLLALALALTITDLI